MKRLVTMLIVVMLLMVLFANYSVKAGTSNLEDFEDDTPGNNPDHGWYTFTEPEGAIYGAVSNRNGGAWTQTFNVNTTGGHNYQSYMTFNNSTWATINLDFLADDVGNNWGAVVQLYNASTRVCGFRNRESSDWEVFSDGGTPALSGISCAADTWYDIIIQINWTADTFGMIIDMVHYGWFEFDNSENRIDSLRIVESSVAYSGDYFIDNINVSDVAFSALVDPPYNVQGQVLDGTTNITWSKGSNADTTVIRKKAGSYPENETDGTLMYNDTGTWNISTVAYGEYVSLWSYNSTLNEYSTKVNMIEGGLRVNCYDENTSSALTFSIFMTNLEGTDTYNASGCTNTYTVDITDAPTGDDILVYINATDYYGRLYYVDIYVGFWYVLNAYLTNSSTLYVLSVIDELDDPVDDAQIEVKRFINESFGYMNVTVLTTDANGYAPTYLVPDVLYKVIINKSGYYDEISDYIPSSTTLAHTFRLINIPDVEEQIYRFGEVIEFNATAYTNGSIRVRYADSANRTASTIFQMYESYNSTNTLVDTESVSNGDLISYWVTGLNLSRLHYVDLFFTHTYNFQEELPIRRFIYPINRTVTNRTQATFDSTMNAIFGRPIINGVNVGWGNLVACSVALVLLCSLTPFHAGVGIMASATGLASVEVMFIMSNLAVLAIIPIVIAIGVLYVLVTKDPGGHL